MHDVDTSRYSMAEAAKVLGVSQSTIRRWQKRGWIKVVVLPSGWRKIPREEVERLLGQVGEGKLVEETDN